MAANAWPSEVNSDINGEIKGHASYSPASSTRVVRERGLSFGVSLVLHIAVLCSLFLVKNKGIDVPFGGDVKGEMVLVEFNSGPSASANKAPKVVNQPVKAPAKPKRLEGDTPVAVKAPLKAPLKAKEKPVEPAKPEEAKSEGRSEPRFGLADGTATSGQLGRSDGYQANERQRYIYELQRYIESRKLYPGISQRLRETGRVKVGFSIQKDGSVTNVAVTGPCGFDRLNEAARDLVQGVGRFKPLPASLVASLESESLALEIPIEYVLR